MNIITYLRDVPLFKKILGILLSSLGLFCFLYASITIGLIFIAIGLNLLSTEGSEINLNNNTYRNIKSLFGRKFGKWKPCPNFEYVSVFKTKENQTVRVVTAETTFQTDIIQLNLFYNGNKHITFYKTKDKNDAFTVAEKFKSVFGIAILDATGAEKVWL